MAQHGLSCWVDCCAELSASVRGCHGRHFHASDVWIHQPANDGFALEFAAKDMKDYRGNMLNERLTPRSGLGSREA
jgi:hypothetical protein